MNAQDIRIQQMETSQKAAVDLFLMDADHIAPKKEFLTQGASKFRNSSLQRVDVQDIREGELILARDEQGNVISFRNIPDTPFYLWDESATRKRQEEVELYERVAAGKLNPAPDFSLIEKMAEVEVVSIPHFAEGDKVTHKLFGNAVVDTVFDNGFVYLNHQADGRDPYVHQSALQAA